MTDLMDRCDQCSAEAFYHGTKKDSILHFCIHHGRMNYDALVLAGWKIQDDSQRINKKPSPSGAV